MGKIKTRYLGIEEVEKKQKVEQKQKSLKKKVHLSGMRGGARMKEIEVDEESLKKMEKAKALIEKTPASPKTSKSPKSPKAKSRGKKYLEAKKLIDKTKTYSIADAVKLLKKIKPANFDESIELHLNIDETGLRGEVEMPNAIGKTVKIKIVDDKVIANLEKGVIDFDILITHPAFMPKLAKYAKVLGPKGLMPNPKAGTVSPKPEEVAKKFEKGTLRWKTEAKFPLIHQIIGKLSHEEKALIENAQALLKAIGASHIQKAVLKSTMSPAIPINLAG